MTYSRAGGNYPFLLLMFSKTWYWRRWRHNCVGEYGYASRRRKANDCFSRTVSKQLANWRLLRSHQPTFLSGLLVRVFLISASSISEVLIIYPFLLGCPYYVSRVSQKSWLSFMSFRAYGLANTDITSIHLQRYSLSWMPTNVCRTGLLRIPIWSSDCSAMVPFTTPCKCHYAYIPKARYQLTTPSVVCSVSSFPFRWSLPALMPNWPT